MNPRALIEIEPLQEALLPEVVRIHQLGLPYTVNSELGIDHLSVLYREMARAAASYVGVAIVGDRPVGVVSGTADVAGLRSRLLAAMPIAALASAATRLLIHPRLVIKLWQGAVISRPVEHGGRPVEAVLTALAVDGPYQGQGVGRALVTALEDFFSRIRIHSYRLDTLASNARARSFYQGVGFIEVARRADSVVLIKDMAA